MKTIELPCFGLVIQLDGKNGTIQSDFNRDIGLADAPQDSLDAIDGALNGIESLVLAHACAGIDVTLPAYVEGIKTAVEAAVNNA